MASHRAMTLVDTLVVTSVLTGLVCLLPAGQQLAQDRAKCLSNIRGLNKAILLYAEANGGNLPVYRFRGAYVGGEYVYAAPSYPVIGTAAFTESPINPRTGLYSDARGFGLLYSQGLMGPPALFYCPAPIADRRHMLSHYPTPWGSRGGSGTMWIRIGYLYNPWVRIVPGSSTAVYEDGLVLERHPEDRCIVTDLNYDRTLMGHHHGNGEVATWNVGYPDGSAYRLTSPHLYRLLTEGGMHYGLSWEVYNAAVRPLMIREFSQ